MRIFIKLIMTLIVLAWLTYLNGTDIEDKKKVNFKANRKIKTTASVRQFRSGKAV